MNNNLAEQLGAEFGKDPNSAVNSSILTMGTEKVILQFSFRQEFLLPAWVYEEKAETAEEHTARKSLLKGVQFLNAHDARAASMRVMLEDEGYTLVDAYAKTRINMNPGEPGDEYYAVRFVFYRNITPMKDLWREILRTKIAPSLDALLANSNWRMRGYKNPHYSKGEIVEGKSGVSINCEFPWHADRAPPKKLVQIENHEVVALKV